MSDTDDLLRALYYTGNYQRCINECLKVFNWDYNQIASDAAFFISLSFLALDKKTLLTNKLTQYGDVGDLPAEAKSILQLCGYLPVTNDIDKLPKMWQCRWIAAVLETEIQKSLEILQPVKNQKDCKLLRIQFLLGLNRIDLVESEDIPSDGLDICTQIASALYYCNIGSYNDAYMIYCELANRYSKSCLLLNNQAVCLMGMGNQQGAKEHLFQALELQSNDASVLWNSMNLDESEVTIDEILSINTKDALLKDYLQKSSEFDKLCDEWPCHNNEGLSTE